jgi:sugar lactone lactonase YvrE
MRGTCVGAHDGPRISVGAWVRFGAVSLVTVLTTACGGDGGGSPSYAVGGTVGGLFGSDLVLQNNGGDDLVVRADGSFNFRTTAASGAPYQVTIKTQPSGPTQVCAVTNASGTIGAGPVTGVGVSCGPIALLAGALGGPGSADGSGSAARFSYPDGVATDSAGNVYVLADATRIYKMTPAGVVTTLVGAFRPALLGVGTSVTNPFFSYAGLQAITASSAGNLYAVDDGNNTVLKITPAGDISTIASLANGGIHWPISVTSDPRENVYVLDLKSTPDLSLFKKITPDGVVRNPNIVDPSLCFDFGSLASDSTGNVYLATRRGICKISPTGVVTPLATLPASYLPGLAVDSGGNLYVADTSETIRKVTAAGVVSLLAGATGQAGYVDGLGTAARFSSPAGAAVDSAGNVYVADTNNHTLRKITSAGLVSTVAGMAPQYGSTDGNGTVARFHGTAGVAADFAGNLYVADTDNCTVRKITSTGEVSTFAGTAGKCGYKDGDGPAAQFNLPGGVTTDTLGNVYVADSANLSIRKITPDGVVSTLGGTLLGVLTNANSFGPDGVATDAMGNVYVADTAAHIILKISPAGVVSTLAGSGGYAGSTDGIGSTARFFYPGGVATDSQGNVHVADSFNHTIRTISPTGNVTTLAGLAGNPGSADGVGTTARFNQPEGLVVDSAGNVYVADTANGTIRKITPNGTVTTVAGTVGVQRISLGTLPGSLNQPSSIALVPGAGVKLAVVGYDSEGAVVEVQLP